MNLLYKKIDLKQIHTFITVCNAKSISIAAEILSISQSSVTQQIKSLERNTNSILFTRTPFGVEPTKTGEIFYNRIKNHYTSFDYAISQMENYHKLNDDKINIAVHYPYLVSKLPSILRNIKEIPIKIHNISREEAEERMLSNEIDIAIYPMYQRNPRFIYQQLSKYAPILILNRDNKLSRKEIIYKEDLIAENFITIDRNLIALDGFSKLYEELCFSTTITLENGNWDILSSLVSQNLGVALLSDLYISKSWDNLIYRDMSHIFQNTPYEICIADPLLIKLENTKRLIKEISLDFYESLIRMI